MEQKSGACLSVENLTVSFRFKDYTAKAIRNLSFSVPDQSTLGIVGESGCGKSMTALSIMKLIPQPPAFFESGRIDFEEKELISAPESTMRKVRGSRISMIFQDPMTSLNPVYTCGFQVRESIEHHGFASPAQSKVLAENILSEVGIENPARVASSYPHQLSGGMRQRVMIAMALCCSPRLLIADEPTTALDVTVQARILDLLHNLQSTKKMSLILITHNLGIVGDIANTVMVMYAGEIMEIAPTSLLFDNPLHPYTSSLLDTIPSLDRKKGRLSVIPGDVPTLKGIPQGCPFHPRCIRAQDRCKSEHPELFKAAENHMVRCLLYEK
jgi:peptide/nickel transport system ATP-binding protein